MITKVGMIILLEHDVDAAVQFYKKLGLQQVFHIKESWAEFKIGDVKLGLCPTSQEPHDRVSGVVLEVEDVKAFYETHKNDIPFRGEPIEKVHGMMVSFKDPGGNIIDLYQPTPEKVTSLVKEVVEKDQAGEGKKGCEPSNCGCKEDNGSA